MSFAEVAPTEVLLIIFEYARHMERVHIVWDKFLTCLEPFMTDRDAPTDESMAEMRDRAFVHGLSSVQPVLAFLHPDDGEMELVRDLRALTDWWVAHYIQEHINVQDTNHPPAQTAQRMIMMANPEAFKEWRRCLHNDQIPEAVDVVWDYNIIPEDIHVHKHEICQRDYFTSVEFHLLTFAHRAFMAIMEERAGHDPCDEVP